MATNFLHALSQIRETLDAQAVASDRLFAENLICKIKFAPSAAFSTIPLRGRPIRQLVGQLEDVGWNYRQIDSRPFSSGVSASTQPTVVHRNQFLPAGETTDVAIPEYQVNLDLETVDEAWEDWSHGLAIGIDGTRSPTIQSRRAIRDKMETRG